MSPILETVSEFATEPAEGLRARFPEHLAAGPRVLKPNYGNGGRNVWRVQLDEAGNAPALKTSVKVQEARQGSKSERISPAERSEEHTSELQSLMRISYAVFCL